MQEGGFQAIAADEDVVGASRVRELERRVRGHDYPTASPLTPSSWPPCAGPAARMMVWS